MNSTVVLCVALLVIFYGALSLNVSRVRRKRRSDSTVPEAALTKAIRAHGNAAEYIPLFVAGLLYLQSFGPSLFVVGLAVAVVACRIMHAAGMLLVPAVTERHPLRFIGALGTYFCLFAMGGAMIVSWFQAGA
ncbi:MAG: MAPEG family protein [Dokdonella sp.]|uniref:MAPEG family protein n=1 Tax=Dokdonella sp. TaxID=2291710 RepID=UPI003262D758